MRFAGQTRTTLGSQRGNGDRNLQIMVWAHMFSGRTCQGLPREEVDSQGPNCLTAEMSQELLIVFQSRNLWDLWKPFNLLKSEDPKQTQTAALKSVRAPTKNQKINGVQKVNPSLYYIIRYPKPIATMHWVPWAFGSRDRSCQHDSWRVSEAAIGLSAGSGEPAGEGI